MNPNMVISFKNNEEPDDKLVIKERLYRNLRTFHAIVLVLLVLLPATLIPSVTSDTISPNVPYGMNISIDPGENFFRFVNDYWIKDNPIPEKNRFYTSFEEVQDLVNKRVKMLVEDAALDYSAENGSPAQLLGSFYRAAINDEANERTGLSPIDDELGMIRDIQDRTGARNITSYLTGHGLDPFFILYIDENPQNRSELIANIDSGDLTLRMAPFYLMNTDEGNRVRSIMKRYVSSVFVDQGHSKEEAEKDADIVLRIDERLARSELLFNKTNKSGSQFDEGTYKVSDLSEFFPGINWDLLFQESGVPDLDEVYLLNPGYVLEVGKILSTEPVDDLKVYLAWRLLQFAAPYATPKMQDDYYRFYDVDLAQGQLTPQKDRVLEVMDVYLGNPIAHLYVDKYFSEDAKKKAEKIITSIREVMRERVNNLTWMSPETKATALKKMDMLKEQAGYPDKWGYYHNLTLTDRSYLENMLELTDYYTNGTLYLSGQPSDPDVWYVSPQGVDAHYDLIHNRIVTPAGFLNPPFFDPGVDDAWNYGSFGWVYGHELIHMIDIGGQQYLPDGKKENWWTDEDADNYFHEAWPLIYQINSTEVLPNLTLNGTRMIIEDSADLGGLTLAYNAYLKTRPDSEDPDTVRADGFTDRQRFFIAFARAMRGNVTSDELYNITMTDDHPWNEFRTNIIPFHLDAFYQAFPDINMSDRLYLNESERSHLW